MELELNMQLHGSVNCLKFDRHIYALVKGSSTEFEVGVNLAKNIDEHNVKQ